MLFRPKEFLFLSFPVPHKTKEVTLENLNDIYPSNNFLHCSFNWEINSCDFCDSDTETLEHFFLTCLCKRTLGICSKLKGTEILVPLTWSDVKVGVLLKKKDTDFLVNNPIVL